MLLDTYLLLMLDTYMISDSLDSYNNSILLNIYSFLGTYSDLTSLITQHLILGQHLKFTRNLLDFWLDTYCSSTCIVYSASTWNWLSVLTLNCQNQSETNNLPLWHECQKHLTKLYTWSYEYIIHVELQYVPSQKSNRCWVNFRCRVSIKCRVISDVESL